jgi:tetratricopeptide (TPR) repeat protein
MPTSPPFPPPAAGKRAAADDAVVAFLENRGRFVLLTDDALFLQLLRGILNSLVGIAGSDGIAYLDDPGRLDEVVAATREEGRVPFLMLDRRMNGADQSAVLKRARATHQDVPILVLTGETERNMVAYLHELGATGFVVKPVSAKTLTERIAAALGPRDGKGRRLEDVNGLLEAGRPGDARKILQSMLDEHGDDPKVLVALGDCALAMGNPAAAKGAWLKASGLAEFFLVPLRRLADLAEREGDLELSLKYLERMDALSPLNPERKVDMGEINLNLGNEGEADRLFGDALSRARKTPGHGIYEMAERVAAVYAEKAPEKATEFLRKAIDAKHGRIGREDVRIFNKLGVSLRRQGRWREAVAEYRRILEVAEDEPVIHYNLGMAYTEGGMHQEARKCMDRVLALDETLPRSSAMVACNMGEVFHKCAAMQKAKWCLGIAVELDPDHRKAKTLLAAIKD